MESISSPTTSSAQCWGFQGWEQAAGTRPGASTAQAKSFLAAAGPVISFLQPHSASEADPEAAAGDGLCPSWPNLWQDEPSMPPCQDGTCSAGKEWVHEGEPWEDFGSPEGPGEQGMHSCME